MIPNHTLFRYSGMTVPCCTACNTEMGNRFEEPMSALFAGGHDAVSEELKNHGPWQLFCWMALMFLKTHLKDKYLNYHLDRRKGDMKIAEIHSWEELHHLHCIVRSFYSGARLDQEVIGSLLVVPAKVRPHFEGFDFIDLSAAQTMLLCIGDVAVIAVLNDSQAAMSVAFEGLKKRLGGPLSPLQLREVAATLACINLRVEPRAQFFSEIDALRETYSIKAARPDEVQMSAWDYELYGQMMHTLTEDMIKGMDNAEEVRNLVKTGRYTFLTTPDGNFDVDSMELAPAPSTDSK